MARVNGAGRRLLIVAGERAWTERWLTDRLYKATDGPADDLLWVARSAPAPWTCVPSHAVSQRLGSESRLLVFNGHDGLHPDAFAIAVGTLRDGGDCVLLMPPPDTWPAFDDPDRRRFAAYPRVTADLTGHFLARLQRLWRVDPGVCIVTADNPDAARPRRAGPAPAAVEITPAQADAIAAVAHVARGHARRPLVITADRGRGKSTLLGIAAASLLADGLRRIVVLAPHRAAVATLWRHAALAAGLPPSAPRRLLIGGGELCLLRPADWRATEATAADLVVVDEAAAIPVGVLEHVLAHANRIVFATTRHGYEGSGRGFDLRFRAALDRAMPQWRAMRLSAPVRWTEGDPLERLLNASFVLDAELADDAAAVGDVSIARCDATTLANDESLLRAVFGLLITAHYQTRPSDLRQLLDNPDAVLWLARDGQHVLGVLLALREGGIDAPMAKQIMSGARRPRGHLLPQSLAFHAGFAECLTLRSLRIQRIAVHPARSGEGIGSRLLAGARTWAYRNAIDLLGCAFGAERRLITFWRRNGLQPVRLGVRVDAASASHSLFMLQGISNDGVELAGLAHARFLDDLPWSLGASLSDLDPVIAVDLLRGRDCGDIVIGERQRTELARLTHGARQIDTADALVWRALVLRMAGDGDTESLAPLCAWRLQHRSVADVCARYAIEGRDALDRALRTALRVSPSDG